MQYGYGGVLPAEQQRADTVRAADLVAGNGHRGKPRGAEVQLRLTEGLDGVGVQRNVEFRCYVGQFTDRQDRADLVVRPHDGGEGDIVRVAFDGLAQCPGKDPAVGVDRQILDGRALVLT